MQAGLVIVSWLEIAGRVLQYTGGCGAKPRLPPLRFSRQLVLVGRELQSGALASLQQVSASLGNVLPSLKGVLPMTYQSLKIPLS